MNLIELFDLDGDALGVGNGRLVLVSSREFKHVGACTDVSRVGRVRGQVGVDVLQSQIDGFVGVVGALCGEGKGRCLVKRPRPEVRAGQEEIVAAGNRDLHHGR